MAKKKKSAAIPSLRAQVRQAMRGLDNIEKDLAQVRATLQKFLDRPGIIATGEDEYFADLRTVIGKRRKR